MPALGSVYAPSGSELYGSFSVGFRLPSALANPPTRSLLEAISEIDLELEDPVPASLKSKSASSIPLLYFQTYLDLAYLRIARTHLLEENREVYWVLLIAYSIDEMVRLQ